MSLLEIQNLNFTYRSKKGNNTFSLRDINFGVERGEFTTLLGPNGSGKSTLLKLISGILMPDEGYIKFEDKYNDSFSRKELARKIAFVPQFTFSIFPFSVYEIVSMGRTPYLNYFGYEKSHDREVIMNALQEVGITNLKNKGINEVSGGEAQRAFIARALAQEPELLLLDEPNAHLDIKHQISIFEILKSLNKEKQMTVLTISHDLNLAGYYSKRAILLKEGKVYLDGSFREVFKEQHIRDVFGVKSDLSFDKENRVHIRILPE